MAWDSVKRIAWRSVKWVLGLIISTIGFIEIASRYEEWKATGWGFSGLPLSSTAWWDIVRIALVILGVSIILSDIWSKIKLRSASFKTEILDKKSAYQEGDIVQFQAEYTGKLKNGYFLADIIPPSGTVLPDGKQKTQAVDNATWHSPWADHGRMGRIRGTNAPPREWGFQIPAKCPTGKYKVVFEVYDGEFGKAKQLGSGEDFFVVESVADVTRQPDEVNVEKLTDLLNLVYLPLYSAVLEMKEGKATFPHTNLTVGNLHNPCRLSSVRLELYGRRQKIGRRFKEYSSRTKRLRWRNSFTHSSSTPSLCHAMIFRSSAKESRGFSKANLPNSNWTS